MIHEDDIADMLDTTEQHQTGASSITTLDRAIHEAERTLRLVQDKAARKHKHKTGSDRSYVRDEKTGRLKRHE